MTGDVPRTVTVSLTLANCIVIGSVTVRSSPTSTFFCSKALKLGRSAFTR